MPGNYLLIKSLRGKKTKNLSFSLAFYLLMSPPLELALLVTK